MNYTINKVAQLSGVTVRTLRFYDEIGLLKPAFVALNGYRYYQEKQLLLLQQILFFRELGFELKHIQDILAQTDFDKLKTLHEHKQLLQKRRSQLTQLLKTIDTTIMHLTENNKISDRALFKGFNPEEQTEHEAYLRASCDNIQEYIDESHAKVAQWSQADWKKASEEFDAICTSLAKLLQNNYSTQSREVQKIIHTHFNWIKKFWTPDKESYRGLGKLYTEPNWQNTFAPYHPNLAQFFCQAIYEFTSNI